MSRLTMQESIDWLEFCAVYNKKENPKFAYKMLEIIKVIKDSNSELQHYKDLEEQGRLIELPCKVGDVVYRHLLERDNYTDFPRIIVAKSSFILADLNRLGKTVFLTKEEAEAKLAELKKHGI